SPARARSSRRDRHALPARLPRQGDHGRGARRPAQRDLGRGREPAPCPEGCDDVAAGAPMTAVSPLTKGARQSRIIDLLTHHVVRSQTELATMLAEQGVHVTQATLSRDLLELDAIKVRGPGGSLVYAVPGEGGDRTPTSPRETTASLERLSRLCGELLVSAEA